MAVKFISWSIKVFFVCVFTTAVLPWVAHADQPSLDATPRILTPKQILEAVKTVQSTWRSSDGETIDHEFKKASEVAHFIPRNWLAEPQDDGTVLVTVNIAKHPYDHDEDTWRITWSLDKNGKIISGSDSERTMDLGSQAFQIAMVQNDIDQGEKSPNKAFLIDLQSLNFIVTSQGRLGNLLESGHCVADDPISVEFTDTWGHSNQKSGQFWRIQASVNCHLSGPKYFTHGGIILFLKSGDGPIRPYSLFASRVASRKPGHWFDDYPNNIEMVTSNTVQSTMLKIGEPLSDSDTWAKSMELRNDGSWINW